MSTVAAPRAPLLQPEQMEGMFGGLDTMQYSLAGSADPDTDKAGWANTAFLAERYGKHPEEIAHNGDAYREDYAKQMFHRDGPIDDKEFYGLVGQHFQTMRNERVLIGEAQGKLFDSFQKGDDNWRGAFTKSLADM